MDLMAPVFNQALKAGHVGFDADTYIQCISSSLYSLTNIIAEDNLGVLFSNVVYATKGAPSKCQQHWPEYGGRDLQ